MKIWLAYVSYPVTTAVYFDRALRKTSKVSTIGPRLPESLLIDWQLQNMKLAVTDQDLATDFTPDMARIWENVPVHERPDLYLWVESVGGHYPQNLNAISCPKCCYLIDSHLSLEKHLIWAQQFDHVFIAQREYLPKFLEVHSNCHWLPLACDPEIHGPTNSDKQFDISFVGSLVLNPRRQELLDRLNTACKVHQERCFWTDMAQIFATSRIVFNSSVKNDLNMRFFEALCSGSLLLSDMARNSGQAELFHDGEDYACYQDDQLVEVARFYLANPLLQEQIAQRGRQMALQAHTYTHRVEELLAVMTGKRATTSTAEDLREQSAAGLLTPFEITRQQHISITSQTRSFVIPVLDYSPASQYNITTLLKDLDTIPGEVIVIFNNPALADEMKGHPRITRSAVMSENIGVARAWNVGISMAVTPQVMILNADLHLETPVIDAIEQGLYSLDQAACVGPQGSFVNHRLTRDFLYFDKGSFEQPVEVDAVSGFLFGVQRNLFGPGGLKFEEAYTPCYFEEWDLGLQIRRAGLKNWIIPAISYDHHWGGSIGSLRTITCLGREETSQDILQRNRQYFLAKWRDTRTGLLPESGWKTFGVEYVKRLLAEKNHEQARQVIVTLATEWPEQPEIVSLQLASALLDQNMVAASRHAKQLYKIAPEFQINLFLKFLEL